ncbi:unnamed protein product [Rhizophagus irregularis]|nr:unnamed protein product [Rhizophagus irregularis]
MDPRATSSSAEVSSRTIFPPITPITSPMKMDPAMPKSPMLEEVVEIINEICRHRIYGVPLDMVIYSAISYKMVKFGEGERFYRGVNVIEIE